MKISLLLLFLLNITLIINSQEPPDNLKGESLRSWYRENYYEGKRIYLNYNEARIFMYGFIDNIDGTITCVYSGFERELPSKSKTTFPDPINCEHTIPQSYFKMAKEREMMKTDLHHLYPVLKSWNSTRSNHPYREIDDSKTTKWMVLNISVKNIPTSDIDSYSEYYNKSFEPPEDHKGNIARAIFYFYTVYEGDNFKSLDELIDIEALFNWHLKDPVDSRELERNDLIEDFQGNRNPYIDYPDTIERAYNKYLNIN